MINDNKIINGRGAQFRADNLYSKESYVKEFLEGIDIESQEDQRTQFIAVHPKTIVNKVNSPDLNFSYSMNPYQGCEHGCVYCYARNSHMYWALEPGLDFESKILYKANAPVLLEKYFQKKSWKAEAIVLSGNTDCYQPIEAKKEITREMLKIILKYKNPVGIITKNALICRDLDLLSELAKHQLVHVMISITTFDEALRRKMEPRTSTSSMRFKTIERLSNAEIPVGVMIAPIIPFLNSHEIPQIAKKAAKAGATVLNHTVVRLNGSIGPIFKDWLLKNYPNKANRVIKHIEELHSGKINDSTFGRRMKGDGNVAQMIQQLIYQAIKKEKIFKKFPPYNFSAFTGSSEQIRLFD